MSPIPVNFAQPGWYTSTFIAQRLKVPLRTVQFWCQSGFFVQRGCLVALLPPVRHTRSKGEYWIKLPEAQKLRVDAILSKVPLDSLNPEPVPSVA